MSIIKNQTHYSQHHQNITIKIDQLLQGKKSVKKLPEESIPKVNNDYSNKTNCSSTGINDFDNLLNGGFVKGSVVLLAGSSGSGKTIFSFQWLFEGIKNDENAIYITLTEPLFKILENLEKISYYNKDAIENEKLKIIDLRKIYAKEGFDQQKILDFVEEEVKRTNAKRLCIDSITAIAYQLDDKAEIRAFIFALGTMLATLGCTTVLTSEVSEIDKYSKYEVEEFISDAILRFDQIKEEGETQRILKIVKIRGKSYRADDIYFKITQDGITIFPKLNVPLEHFSTSERISMGISALDKMLDGGIFVGSSTLITGSPGTGKSTLGLSFIFNGLKNGEPCLYTGFEESREQVLRNAKNFGMDFEKYEKNGLLIIRCIYPNEKHLEEHLLDIKNIVEQRKIKRCVVDPISAISSSYSLESFINFSKRLNGYLKTRKVTPLFTSATTSLISATKTIDNHLSTVSDNIILLRYVEMQGTVQSVINIIKMRGSEHSKSLILYDITNKGLVLGDSLEDYEGITTGVSKKIAELKKESEELKKIIKEKESAENALQESEQKFRLLVENSNDVIMLTQPNSMVSYMSPACKKVLGYNPKDLIGKVPNIFHPDDVKKVQQALSSALDGKSGSNLEYRIITKNKNTKWVGHSWSSIMKDNSLQVVVSVIRDISEQKEIEGALKERNKELKGLYSLGILTEKSTDLKNLLNEFVNKIVPSSMQFQDKTIALIKLDGKTYCNNKNCKIKNFLSSKIKINKKERGELIVGYKDNLPFIPDFEKNLINAYATRLGHIILDYEKEEKINKQNIQLKKLDKIKTDFFEVTSREIRAPLATIKGYMQMLFNQAFGPLTKEQKKYFEIMIKNTNNLDDLVSDLVDISRIEAGDMTFNSKQTNVKNIIKESVEEIKSFADIKNIEINVEIDDQIPEIFIDQNRIKQVIFNILENAIKFSPEKTQIDLRTKKLENEILFEIQDSGQGIPKEKQKKIFNAFYKAEEGKNKEYSGGGIGLALSRSIVTIHGGKIWVESKQNKGSTFSFTIPIQPVCNIQTKCKEFDIFGLKQGDEDAD